MKKYRVWSEINLKRLGNNIRELRGRLNSGHKAPPEILVVVKADAYGHGAVPIGKTVLENGAAMLGVDEMKRLFRALRRG